MKGLEKDNGAFVLPQVHELPTPLVSVVTMQLLCKRQTAHYPEFGIMQYLTLTLLSYYAALHRDCDVDKPGNLAMSVTVA